MPSSPRPSRRFRSADQPVYNPRRPGNSLIPEYDRGGEAVLNDESSPDEELLQRNVLRLNANVTGIVSGILLGLMIFLATTFLLLKGGEVIGPHLGLLSQFFYGYSVSFVGSLIGFTYGLLCGYVAGFLTAWLYNKVVTFRS
jgi:hypothetical protein